MKYEDMSDFEVNSKIAQLFIGGVSVYHERSHGNHDGDVWLNDSETGALRYTNFNPCNNPSDAWPIIVENEIAITPQHTGDGFWCASHSDTSVISWKDMPPKFTARDKNPLRAAMICFLKMKEQEK